MAKGNLDDNPLAKCNDDGHILFTACLSVNPQTRNTYPVRRKCCYPMKGESYSLSSWV
jgi:hypothetical protein